MINASFNIVILDIQYEEEKIQKHASGKFYMRDQLYRQHIHDLENGWNHIGLEPSKPRKAVYFHVI